MRYLRYGILIVLGLGVLVACSSAEPDSETTPAEVNVQGVEPPTGTAEVVQVNPTASPAVDPTATQPTETLLTVWIVDVLDDETAAVALSNELAAFDETYPDIRVEIYTKRIRGAGGILDYLRTADPVAPDVLPDLVLLDRESLAETTRSGQIVPYEVLGDPGFELYAVARQLATVDGVFAGVPYVMDLQHSVYRTTVFTEAVPNSFEVLLDEESPGAYTFPAGPVTGVSRTVLDQYIAAGGELVNAEGAPFLDVDALTRVLDFYAQANEDELFDPIVFQYATIDETWNQYRLGETPFAAVTSTLYLAEREEVRSTGLTWTPTPEGTPIALASGLFWTVVTEDPQQQDAAVLLIDFLLDPVNQGALTQAVGWLPSQPAALTVWGDDDPYVLFGDTVLQNARPLPDSAIRSEVGAAIQEALEDVLLSGELPAQAAAKAGAKVNGEENEGLGN